ncbi:MAG: carboxypeptidase regulatory-like domain-containing protein [Candidatus Saccharimonadales bacterium]
MDSKGFTIIEILVSAVVIGIMSISLLGAYVALNSTAIFSRQKIIGTQLATNRLEYLKSLPYDNLAVAGGAIPHPTPLPSTETIVLDNVSYEIRTSINYADDAFDGCAAYATPAIKSNLCRNLPEPAAATTDTNPADYKIANVKVNVLGKKVSELDTNIAARVAETNSTTGSLSVTVIDSSGNPVSGATVNVNNTVLNPDIDVNDSTDVNGVAIFYGLPPHATNSYRVTASKSGYSTIFTIPPSGSLAPSFASQNIVVQQSSSVTLTIDPMGEYSLLAEVKDTNGNNLANMRTYAKGGQKLYSNTADSSYYFDNFTPTDTRPTSDASGNFVMENLTPGSYIFCGDNGAANCRIGGTAYYLVASVPYAGTNQIGPISIPAYVAASPPSPTFPFGGNGYYQQARLIFSTNSNFPRIYDISDGAASKASGTHTFTIKGTNLPCDASNPAACGTSVTIKNSAGNMDASCIGSASVLTCTIDVSAANVEQSNITLTANGFTINIPNGSGMLGGVNVTP